MSVTEFIQKSVSIHGENKFDYSKISKEDIKDCKSKIPLSCFLCNYEYYPSINTHIYKKRGCPKCSNHIKHTLDMLIDNSKLKYGEKFDYSNIDFSKFKNRNTKIKLKCRDCNYSWETNFTSHLNASKGCPSCSKHLRYNLNVFLEKAHRIHQDAFDYSKVDTQINKGKDKVIIICKKCGYQTCTTVESHIRQKTGCSNCTGSVRWDINRFLVEANKIHSDKYDYSSIENIKNSRQKIMIKCKKCLNTFESNVILHIHQKCGCPKCSKYFKWTLENFIIKSNLIHEDKYNYEKVTKNQLDSEGQYIPIKCNICNYNWASTVNNHINSKTGCPLCNKKLVNKITKDEILNIEKFYKDKILFHNIENVKDENSHVEFNCKKCDKFYSVSVRYLLKFKDCIKCLSKIQYSLSDFNIKSNEIYGSNFNYYNLKNEMMGSHKILLQCNVCFYKRKVKIYKHLVTNLGCPKCSGYFPLKLEDLENKLNLLGSKNIILCPNDPIKNRDSKITLICSDCNHKWDKKVRNCTKYKLNCPKCILCPSCFLFKTNGVLCSYCKPFTENKLYQKTKEMKVVQFLRDNLPDQEFIHNKSVSKDCTNSHLFPDIRFDCIFYNLIIEVDEFKHRGAQYSCDEKRMYDIIAKLGQPCIFIRYNPDSKQSNLEILLEKVKEYLDCDENTKVWDEYGFLVEYLFY